MENRYDTGTEDQEGSLDMERRLRDILMELLYLHGWEDPTWGRRTIDQLALAMTIHDLGAKIADEEMRRQIQSSAASLMVILAQDVVKESH
jgi:hypothetical protein